MQPNPKLIIGSMVDKKHIYLFSSIEEAMRQISNIFKYKTFIIPDQCCPNYYKIPESYNELKTIYGIIDMKDLISKCQNKILLLNGMASSFAEQPVSLLLDVCKEKNCSIINDVSTSLNLSSARLGEYSLCSLDKSSFINLGYGAFFASNAELNLAENFDKSKINDLNEKLSAMDSRVKYLSWANAKVKVDLNSFEILHRDKRSISILIRFDTLMEKRRLVSYCEKSQLPYEIAPKYLKSNPNLIAIEIIKK